MNENEGLNCISEDCVESEADCCSGYDSERPRNESILKDCVYDFRDFTVKKLNYGYIITVGCHRFAIEDKKKVIKLISEYVDDPNKVESKWWKNKTLSVNDKESDVIDGGTW